MATHRIEQGTACFKRVNLIIKFFPLCASATAGQRYIRLIVIYSGLGPIQQLLRIATHCLKCTVFTGATANGYWQDTQRYISPTLSKNYGKLICLEYLPIVRALEARPFRNLLLETVIIRLNGNRFPRFNAAAQAPYDCGSTSLVSFMLGKCIENRMYLLNILIKRTMYLSAATVRATPFAIMNVSSSINQWLNPSPQQKHRCSCLWIYDIAPGAGDNVRYRRVPIEYWMILFFLKRYYSGFRMKNLSIYYQYYIFIGVNI